MWVPSSEADLRAAASAGTLNETSTRLELKQEIEATEAGRRKLAEELASLAVDGGMVIIGVVDVKHRVDAKDPDAALHPIVLTGEPERIELIAATRCDPPLFVRTRPLPSTADATKGYLVVEIPPSPAAPHMVDGRYWGRGDTTKRRLTDTEVLRLHERRRVLEDQAVAALTEYVERDPVKSSGIRPRAGHLFYVAQPLAGRPDMLLEVAEDQGHWQQWFINLTRKRANSDPKPGAHFAPNIDSATNMEKRPDGWAGISYDIQGRRVDADVDESHLIEIELTTDGAVRLFCGRGTEVLRETGTVVMFEGLVADLAFRTVCLAADVAEATAYQGDWLIGMAATGIRDARSYELHQSFSPGGLPYPDDDYRWTTRASTAELQDNPRIVAGRIAGRLIRVFGTERSQRVALFITV